VATNDETNLNANLNATANVNCFYTEMKLMPHAIVWCNG